MERAAITQRVILWCVEAYFGQLGGEIRWKSDNGEVPAATEDV